MCLKWFYPPIIFLGTVCVTEMAEVVVPAQVFEQLVVIKVTIVAELAERVSSVAGVIWVSVRSVTRQLLTVVPLSLMGENLMGSSKQVSRSTWVQSGTFGFSLDVDHQQYTITYSQHIFIK